MSLEHDPTQETPEESRGYVPQVHLEPEQPVDPESGVPDSEANHAPLPEHHRLNIQKNRNPRNPLPKHRWNLMNPRKQITRKK